MKKIANCKIYSVLVGSTPIDCIAGVFVHVIAMLLNRNTELQIAERLWPVKGRGFLFLLSPVFFGDKLKDGGHSTERSSRYVPLSW